MIEKARQNEIKKKKKTQETKTLKRRTKRFNAVF